MKRSTGSLLVQRLLALFALAAALFAAPLWWHGSAFMWFAWWGAVIAALAWLMERGEGA